MFRILKTPNFISILKGSHWAKDVCTLSGDYSCLLPAAVYVAFGSFGVFLFFLDWYLMLSVGIDFSIASGART